MTSKTLLILLTLAVAIEQNLAAPTSSPETSATPTSSSETSAAPTSSSEETSTVAATNFTPFESRNMDELVNYILKITVHKFDAKVPVIEHRIKRFLEAVDMLIEDTANDDSAKTKMYTEVRRSVAESLKVIQEDTQRCGVFLVAMSKLGHITDLVTKSGDAQLWNYWTLSNIDEKTLFVSVGYPYENLDEYRESQRFFEKNEDVLKEAKSKASTFVNENCQKYKEFYGDAAISI